jgi:hypothetical protein
VDAVGRDDLGDEAPARGPYDIAAAPDGVQRLDLGSLRIPAVPEVEIRVQANPEGVIQQVVLVHGENALQLGVFAAPRSEGIWDEVREEIRTSLLADRATVEETDGEYGVELWARVQTTEGVTNLRFVGVDGPRWMVRGVYQGAAATDPGAAGPLADCLAGLVVDRGHEAKPVREPLPLRLPREAGADGAGQPGAAGQPGPGDPAGAGPARSGFNGVVTAPPGANNRGRPPSRPV